VKLALAFLLAMVATATAAERTACRTAPDTSIPPPWAWRMVDGKQCWYPGERKRAKHLLHWTWDVGPAATAAKESAASISPASETEPSTPTAEPPEESAPAPEQLQSYSPEDQKLLESYWPDLPTLMAERSPAPDEMLQPPPQSARWRDHDMIMLLVLALVMVSGLAFGLELVRTKLDQRRTA
jgi:hypothetical protein